MMPWRVAKKIRKAIGTAREAAYSGAQLDAALDRYDRLRTARQNRDYWHALMGAAGVLGRAEVLAGCGAPGMALDLLMRTPESEWRYGKARAR